MATLVSTSDYRARLREWHDRARQGEDLVVTEHGVPVVRVAAADSDALLDRLEHQGLLRRASTRRPASALPAVSAPGDSTPSVSAGRAG